MIRAVTAFLLLALLFALVPTVVPWQK